MALVSQWIWRRHLAVFAIMGILASQFVATAVASQGPSVPGEGQITFLPLAGYDFTEAGRDVYGTQDLTLYGDADTVYDLERGHVLQLGGTGYALAKEAHLDIGDALSICYWIKEAVDCPPMNILVGQGWDEGTGGDAFSVRRVNELKFELCCQQYIEGVHYLYIIWSIGKA